MILWLSAILPIFASPKMAVLDNGLTLVVDETTHIPQISSHLHFRFSPDDVMDGLPHLIEHLLFEGAQHTPNGLYDQLVEQANGFNNAKTSFNEIVIEAQFDSSALETMLFLETDRMGYLCGGLTQEDLDNQKMVIFHEIWNEQVRYLGGLADHFRKMSFDNAIFSKEIMGTLYDLELIQLDDVCSFAQQWLKPQYLTWVMVGDINFEMAQERVTYWTSDLEGSTEARIASQQIFQQLSSNTAKKPKVQKVYYPSQEAQGLFLIFAGPKLGSQEEGVVDFIMEVLKEPQSIHQTSIQSIQVLSESTEFGGWILLEIQCSHPEDGFRDFQQILQHDFLWYQKSYKAKVQRLLLEMQMKNASRAKLLFQCSTFLDATEIGQCYEKQYAFRSAWDDSMITEIVQRYFDVENATVIWMGVENPLGWSAWL